MTLKDKVEVLIMNAGTAEVAVTCIIGSLKQHPAGARV